MIVDSAAKLINKKNIAPQILLPGISLNTFGSVINTKFGPLPGFTPNAKHAGKITSPAINATNVSRIATLIASPVSLWLLSMLIPKIAIDTIHRLRFKNAWTIAADTTFITPCFFTAAKSGIR